MALGGGGAAATGAPAADDGNGDRGNTADSPGTWTIAGPCSAVCASFALTVFNRTGVTASWTATALADSAARGSRFALAKGSAVTVGGAIAASAASVGTLASAAEGTNWGPGQAGWGANEATV